MKFRHTAALALVGWYVLMLPPLKCEREPITIPAGYCQLPSGCHVDFKTPLANWTPLGISANSAYCEVAREQTPCPKLDRAKCVSVNDPRIQGVFLGGIQEIPLAH
jgi:hypothetical protein